MDTASDIISQMFASNLDGILQNIFLILDPASLKDARCVCRKWNQFIKDRLWRSIVGRKKLESRLCYRWKNETNVKKKQFAHQKEINEYVDEICCDDGFVYLWTCDGIGIISVYSLSTGELVHRLDCDFNSDGRYYHLTFDVGETELATLYEDDQMCVWDKRKGEILFQKKCSIDNGTMCLFSCLKVISRGKVLLGFSDGSLALIMANQENEWSTVNTYTDLREGIFSIDNDGDWVVTGTGRDVYLWKLVNDSLVLDPRSIKIEDGMYTFSYPFIFAVAHAGCTGLNLQVWDIDTKDLVRHVDINFDDAFNIKSNGRFIIISGVYDVMYVDIDVDVIAVVFDKKELCDSKITDDILWRMIQKEDCDEKYIATTINTTSLVVINKTDITVQNYWDDS